MLSRTHVAVLISIALALFCARVDASHVAGFSHYAPSHVAHDCDWMAPGSGSSFMGYLPSPMKKLLIPIVLLILFVPMASAPAACALTCGPKIFRRAIPHPVLRWGLAAGAGGIPPDGV